jgi:hypothetical protein
MKGSLVVWVVLAGMAPAAADTAVERAWPAVPEGHQLTLDDQIRQRISEIGNRLGRRLDTLSRDVVVLHVDGRTQRAYLRVGGGGTHYLNFDVASSWYFADGMARVATRVDLSIAGHQIELKLPDFEMVPTSFNGERYVELRLPLLERRF